MRTAIITGISGQSGGYLGRLLLEKGYRVLGYTRDKSKKFFNLCYLGIAKNIELIQIDLLDTKSIINSLKKILPDEIYNLSAQSSVSFSFDHPVDTVKYNIMSAINILESIRLMGLNTRFYQASSSEMYGENFELPIIEKSHINPVSPYAISKAAVHFSVINYRKAYGLYACNGILFNHESFLRSPEFFVKKVIRTALDIKSGREKILRVGNLNSKRDFGYTPDYVKAMWLMLQRETPEDFVICSGKSVSLKEIVYYVFENLGLSRKKIKVDPALYRPIDLLDIYGDCTKANTELGWKYEKNFFDVLDILIEEEKQYNQ